MNRFLIIFLMVSAGLLLVAIAVLGYKTKSEEKEKMAGVRAAKAAKKQTETASDEPAETEEEDGNKA